MADSGGSHYNWYFLAAMVIHFVIDGLWRFQGPPTMRFTIYFIMFVVGWLFVFEPHRSKSAFGRSLALAASAFFLPYLLNMDIIVSSLGTRNIDIILAVLPVYLLYFFFVEPDLLTPRMAVLRTIYIWVFIIIAVSWMYQAGRSQIYLGTLDFIPGLGGPAAANILGVWWDIILTVGKTVWGFIVAVYDFIKDLLYGPAAAFQRLFNDTINPEQYTGQTDTKAKQKLGVYIENMKPTDNYFYVGEPISVYSTLVADTLDKPIAAKISCMAKSDRSKEYDITASKVYPSAAYTFEGYNREDIDCIFDEIPPERGTYKVTMFVDFDFETQAYQKVYLADRGRSSSLRREGRNILDVYKISDKSPKAIYTEGPVMVGMSIGKEQPVELDVNNPEYNRLTLGISLKNNWEGVIKQINRLAIMMPKSMAIDSSQCSSIVFVEGSCADMNLKCDDKVYRVYKLKDKQESWFSNIASFKTIRCPITISPGNILLGNSPVITEFFRINTQYKYVLEKSTSATVKEVSGT